MCALRYVAGTNEQVLLKWISDVKILFIPQKILMRRRRDEKKTKSKFGGSLEVSAYTFMSLNTDTEKEKDWK